MSVLLPDWLLVISTMAGICVFITGRVRLATLLAGPALMRFVIWPVILAVLQGIPVLALALVGIVALPVVAIRTARKLLILFVGEAATDHALGRALGQGIIHLFSRTRSPD